MMAAATDNFNKIIAIAFTLLVGVKFGVPLYWKLREKRWFSSQSTRRIRQKPLGNS